MTGAPRRHVGGLLFFCFLFIKEKKKKEKEKKEKKLELVSTVFYILLL